MLLENCGRLELVKFGVEFGNALRTAYGEDLKMYFCFILSPRENVAIVTERNHDQKRLR